MRTAPYSVACDGAEEEPSVRDLHLLVLSDLHYVGQASHTCPLPARKASMGRELIQKAWEGTLLTGTPDVLLLLGDLVDNGHAKGVEVDLTALREEVLSFGVPILAVRGNHDVPAEPFRRAFPGQRLEIGGYLFLAFDDPYDPNDQSYRPKEGMTAVLEESRNRPQQPIIVLQHSPVHPPIDSHYPYLLKNCDEVLESYRQANVLLSLSGHYHPGQAATRERGVTYVTCPALCEEPFRFLQVRLRGHQVSIEECSLESGAM